MTPASAGLWLAGDHPDPELLVVGVPSSRSSIPPSRADMTPLTVRDRFDRFSTFHGEIGVDFSPVRVRDAGNWAVSELDDLAMIGEVIGLAKGLTDANLSLFLGGDNAITRPLVAALDDDLTRVGLITLDAGHDVQPLDDGPTNRAHVRGLIEEHGLPGSNVVQIGVHPLADTAESRAWCDDTGITTVTVGQIGRIGMSAAIDVALSQLAVMCDSIYVDVDLTVLDRALAPGCPRALPGGLGIGQLAEGVARCAGHRTVKTMDFVEVDPDADVGFQTLDTLAYLVLTAVAGYAGRQPRS